MTYETSRNGLDNITIDTETTVPDADVISLETVINMLVRKNICSPEELFMLEGKIREQNKNTQKINFVSIKQDNGNGRGPWLKKWMGKRRWTRKIGGALFGWKWKKIKKSPQL